MVILELLWRKVGGIGVMGSKEDAVATVQVRPEETWTKTQRRRKTYALPKPESSGVQFCV